MNRHEYRAQAAINRKGKGRPLAGEGPRANANGNMPYTHRGMRRGFNPNRPTHTASV